MSTSAQEEQKLRRALAGSNTTTTYHSWAGAHLELERSGRHAAASKATVTGTEASVRYPRLPENNPFTTDISGVEPPLGYAINDLEVNGTPAEIEESISRLAAQPIVPPDGSAEEGVVGLPHDDAPAPDCAIPLGSQSGANSLLRRGRKL
jgi:hypothetical protein